MAGGIADIVQIVVLAAGADAFLRSRGRRVWTAFQAGEDVLELHHAGIGEHQRRVIARHQRAGRHDLVAVLLEIVEEGRPDVIHAAHATPFVPPDADPSFENQWLLSPAPETVQPNAEPAAHLCRHAAGEMKRLN